MTELRTTATASSKIPPQEGERRPGKINSYYFRCQAIWLSTGLLLILCAAHFAPGSPIVANPQKVIQQYLYISLPRAWLEITMRLSALVFFWSFISNLFWVRSWQSFANLLLLASGGVLFWVGLNIGILDLLADAVQNQTNNSGPGLLIAVSNWKFDAIIFAAAIPFTLLCPFFSWSRATVPRPNYFTVIWLYTIATVGAVAIAAIMSRPNLHEATNEVLIVIAANLASLAAIAYGWWLDVKGA